MPQIDWTPEFKRSTTVEFDRLKLKVGERARIVVMERPTMAWVHTLRAPKIVNGQAVKVVKKRKDNSEYTDWDLDFIGRPQCLGDHGIIADEGLDAKNCPVCARAKESEETSPPERRYAMNVIKYNTRADGTPVSPFGCSSQVWAHTEGIYNKLYAIAQEYGQLVGRDLVLGPCQAPEAFQKFDISVGAKNLWEENEAVKKTVLETYENNKLEVSDLETACGRRSELRWLKDDLDKIRNRWRTAHGAPAASSEKADVASLKGELDAILAPPAPEVSGPEDNNKTASDESAKPSAGGSDPDDFSKLLANLKL